MLRYNHQRKKYGVQNMYYDCDKVRERFSAGYDGKENIAVHLQTCAECAAAYAEYKAFMDELRALPEPDLPDDFHKRVMQAVRAEVRGDTRRRNKIAGWATLAAACFLAAVIWSVGIILPGQQEPDYGFVEFAPFVAADDVLHTYVQRRGGVGEDDVEINMGIIEPDEVVPFAMALDAVAFFADEWEPEEEPTRPFNPAFAGILLLLFGGAGATLMAVITLRR